MKVQPTLGELSDTSADELTAKNVEYLKQAAEIIAEECRQIADVFSRRIPMSLEVKSDDRSVYILGGGPAAPNAYPFDPPTEPPVYHPVWGHGPREGWHWAAQPYRPFLEEGAERAGERAADVFARIIDEWAKEIGNDRP